ncbi:hypothetical protein AX17_005652 [Amanita inopinata Kibby_2008]|nr:hypothetical protein AX17_005652 [Amanita inopinata Kibby_2008]
MLRTKQVESEKVANKQTLAEEIAKLGNRKDSKYWTYIPVFDTKASSPELATKWGIDKPTEETEMRQTRAMRRRKGEPTVSQVEEKGRLSRRLADLNRHFNRAPDELAMEREMEIMEECLSGELALNTCLSCSLTSEGCDNSKQEPEVDSVMEGAFVAYPVKPADFGRNLNNYVLGQLASPSWYELNGNEDQLGPLLIEWIKGTSSEGPPTLPKIESSDSKSLLKVINEQLNDFKSCHSLDVMALIVEMTSEVEQKSGKDKSQSKGRETLTKGKRVDPGERGPIYDTI